MFVGNVDPATKLAAEYNGAVLLRTDDGVMLLHKILVPIAWTQVLKATIGPDDTITVT